MPYITAGTLIRASVLSACDATQREPFADGAAVVNMATGVVVVDVETHGGCGYCRFSEGFGC